MSTLQTKSPTYDAFVEKFQPKKTTDDCYTPDEVYNQIAEWVHQRYTIDRAQMVRPFWPGWSYKGFGYEPNCVVVDNPPFSILSEIVNWYNDHGVRYFLFAPMLTCFTLLDRCDCVLVKPVIVYENGAKVRTAFVTNLPTLYKVEYSDTLSDRLAALTPSKAKKKTEKPANYWIASEFISTKTSLRKKDFQGIAKKTPDGRKIFGAAVKSIYNRKQ